MKISIMSGLTSGNSDSYEFNGGTSTPGSGATASTIQTICVYGTWDGATATHQISSDAGVTWIDIDTTNAAATANKVYNVEARAGAIYRISVSSAGASTSLSADALV